MPAPEHVRRVASFCSRERQFPNWRGQSPGGHDLSSAIRETQSLGVVVLDVVDQRSDDNRLARVQDPDDPNPVLAAKNHQCLPPLLFGPNLAGEDWVGLSPAFFPFSAGPLVAPPDPSLSK